MNYFLLSDVGQKLLIIFGLLAFFGVIVAGVIIFKRKSKHFKNTDKKPTETEIVKEELNRVLEDVKDEETIKAMQEYDKNVNEEKTTIDSKNK